MNPEYIESYEDEYGVIFEFVTMREYRLIALDDKQTQTTLYQNAPANIKRILENNYGYHNDLRNSVSGPDREISQYICSLGYDGYGIHDMRTDNMGGIFPITCCIIQLNIVSPIFKLFITYLCWMSDT